MNESLHSLPWFAVVAIFAAILLLLIAVVRLCYRVYPDTAYAPMLDVWVSLFSWAPWVAGGVCFGWRGLLASLAAQALVLHVFCWGDRLLRGKKGFTIMGTLRKMVGVCGNQLGLYATLPALPLFLQIRLAQWVLYPILTATVRFPKYCHRDWISLSRQKFDGLVGYDLVFCLYCEWAAGVYGLGAEMLRNVESFWCPIRFHHEKKCDNCRMDFPDISSWVKPEGSMEEVSQALETKYRNHPTSSWWDHPDRRKDAGRDE